jgi:hypothetical protein
MPRQDLAASLAPLQYFIGIKSALPACGQILSAGILGYLSEIVELV